jgi:hypothetical protein
MFVFGLGTDIGFALFDDEENDELRDSKTGIEPGMGSALSHI